MLRIVLAGAFQALAAILLIVPVTAQTAEEQRLLDFGKEIFKNKAQCQYCHKWDASGDQGYGGNALSLRVTQLTRQQMMEVVKCGRPGTNMPYHDQFAYTDKRCYGVTRADLGQDMPIGAINESLNSREIEAVVNYLFANAVGRGPATHDECLAFWGSDTRQCDPIK